jgi:DNA repair protein RadD
MIQSLSLKKKSQMKLRHYQLSALALTLKSLREGNNPVISAPTGSGKSAIIAALVDRFREREGYTLMVTHNRELVQQNALALERFFGADGVGVYCAGLDSYNIGTKATYASIQSIYRNLHKLPTPDAIIIDEAHWVSPKESDGKMYNTLLKRFPDSRRIGLSATPYRLSGGLIYSGDDPWFNDLAVDISVQDLVDQGFLAPLKGLSARVQLNLKGVHRTNGDYDTAEVDERMTDEWMRAVIESVKRLASERKSILLFSPTVRTAKLAAKIANELGISADYVHGGDNDRADRLERWKAGEFTLMANCKVLTTGFDRPDLECIVDAAPTQSIGLHRQKLGRGARTSPGKTDCLILDVAGNLARHGGIAAKAEIFEERANGALVAAKPVKKQTIITPRTIKTATNVSDVDPMAGSASVWGMDVAVMSTKYITKRSTKSDKNMLMALYSCITPSNTLVDIIDFILVEHDGYARKKAEDWFKQRGYPYPPPRSAQTARSITYSLPSPRSIRVRRRGSYYDVLSEKF